MHGLSGGRRSALRGASSDPTPRSPLGTDGRRGGNAVSDAGERALTGGELGADGGELGADGKPRQDNRGAGTGGRKDECGAVPDIKRTGGLPRGYRHDEKPERSVPAEGVGGSAALRAAEVTRPR